VRDIRDSDADLTGTGNPQAWYFTSETTIAVYPPNSSVTLTVHYFKTPAELSADGDTPALPARYHGLIVDGAVIRAYRDSDNYDQADRAQQHLDRRLQQMADRLLAKQRDSAHFVTLTNPDAL
jgi:hypothetical protein